MQSKLNHAGQPIALTEKQKEKLALLHEDDNGLLDNFERLVGDTVCSLINLSERSSHETKERIFGLCYDLSVYKNWFSGLRN